MQSDLKRIRLAIGVVIAGLLIWSAGRHPAGPGPTLDQGLRTQSMTSLVTFEPRQVRDTFGQ